MKKIDRTRHQTDIDRAYGVVAATWTAGYRQQNFQARLAVVGEVLEGLSKISDISVVLDYGGGTGVFSAVASHRAELVICLDRSVPMAISGAVDAGDLSRIAREAGFVPRLDRVKRLAGDLDALAPSALHSFDLVLCIAVLEYISDVDTVIDRLIDLLQPTGHLLLTVPNPRSPYRWWEQVNDCSRRLGKSIGLSVRPSAYLATRPHGSRVPWRRALRRRDFGIVVRRGIPRGLTGPRRWLNPNQVILARTFACKLVGP
jgi:SAM-dependent methyltransferase